MAPAGTNQMPEPRSALLLLPQELRDQIYKDLLTTTTFLVENPRNGEILSYLPLHQHTRLAILNVSRLIYEEAKRLLYRHGHFHLNAFTAGSPPLHEEIKNIPDIRLLQDITINLDVGTAFSLGYKKAKFAGSATMLISYLARLDPAFPGKRCVVVIELVLDASFLLGLVMTAGRFKDALGRLTAFRTVEVKIGHLRMRLGGDLDCMAPLYNALDERLAMTLGGGEKGCDEEGRFCLVYHPRRG